MIDTTLQFWGVIGTWVASIGTVSAVIMSLWLAWDKNQVKLKIKVVSGLRLLGYNENSGLWFRVVNIGNQPVHITQLGLTVRRGKIKNDLLLFFDKESVMSYGLTSDTIPKTIGYGEEGSFMFPFSKLVEEFAKDGYSEQDIRKTKAIIATSVRSFVVKIEKGFMDKLIKEVMANRK